MIKMTGEIAWGMDGGVLTNQAIHHIDLLTWMMDLLKVSLYYLIVNTELKYSCCSHKGAKWTLELWRRQQPPVLVM